MSDLSSASDNELVAELQRRGAMAADARSRGVPVADDQPRDGLAPAQIWHDEADRLATWGTLDPPDACMCRACVLEDCPHDWTLRPESDTWVCEICGAER